MSLCASAAGQRAGGPGLTPVSAGSGVEDRGKPATHGVDSGPRPEPPYVWRWCGGYRGRSPACSAPHPAPRLPASAMAASSGCTQREPIFCGRLSERLVKSWAWGRRASQEAGHNLGWCLLATHGWKQKPPKLVFAHTMARRLLPNLFPPRLLTCRSHSAAPGLRPAEFTTQVTRRGACQVPKRWRCQSI